VTSTENFKKNVETLIGSAHKYTGNIIFVGLTLVDECKTAPLDTVYFLNEKIRKYEKLIEKECKKRNIAFLNIADEWSKLDYLELLSDDGIHLNEKGHQRIFEKIQPLFS